MAKVYPKAVAGKSKEALQLKKGDVLSTGAVVLNTSSGVSTPSGKIDVDLKYPNGKTVRSTWNKKTVIRLKENKLGDGKMSKIVKIKLSEMQRIIEQVVKEEESKYQKFFKAALAKYGVSSPEELGDKKAEFFKYVEDNWTGEKTQDGDVAETLEPVSLAAGQPKYNPTQRVRAKKRDQILASEEAKAEAYVRRLVREELKFVVFSDIEDGVSRKRAKKRIAQKGSSKTSSTV